MEFSRQEYWSSSPFPSSWDLPNPGIEPESPALQGDSLPSEPPGKPPKVVFKSWLWWMIFTLPLWTPFVLFYLPEILLGTVGLGPTLQKRSWKLQFHLTQKEYWEQSLIITSTLHTHFALGEVFPFCLANSDNWPLFFISLPIDSSSGTFIDPMAMHMVLSFPGQQTSHSFPF